MLNYIEDNDPKRPVRRREIPALLNNFSEQYLACFEGWAEQIKALIWYYGITDLGCEWGRSGSSLLVKHKDRRVGTEHCKAYREFLMNDWRQHEAERRHDERAKLAEQYLTEKENQRRSEPDPPSSVRYEDTDSSLPLPTKGTTPLQGNKEERA
jgi:hypothetical protein